LADLEKEGLLQGIVTQNIDNLHQAGGSKKVLEIHGNHHFLHCIACGAVSEPDSSLLTEESVPRCGLCEEVLKPDVVLFGENVRNLSAINDLLHRCDLIMVIGTSAQVYPAASLPQQVKLAGGMIYEFNVDETVLTRGQGGSALTSDYFFQGSASAMLQLLKEHLKTV
jgi:NAD-dependent deacetylase